MRITMTEFRFGILKELKIMFPGGIGPFVLNPGETYTLNEQQISIFTKGFIENLEHEGYITLIESKGVNIDVDFS